MSTSDVLISRPQSGISIDQKEKKKAKEINIERSLHQCSTSSLQPTPSSPTFDRHAKAKLIWSARRVWPGRCECSSRQKVRYRLKVSTGARSSSTEFPPARWHVKVVRGRVGSTLCLVAVTLAKSACAKTISLHRRSHSPLPLPTCI